LVFNCQKFDLVFNYQKVDLVVRPILVEFLRQEYEVVNEEFNINNLGNCPKHGKRRKLNR